MLQYTMATIKTLVTHISPDLDAITSMWLIVRNLHGWEHPQIFFVPAGQTLNNEHPDDNPDIIHVDTGMGKFDHHQLKKRTSAARRVLDYVKEHGQIRKTNEEPLERLVDVVTLYDNFGEANFPDPTNDIYNFSINEIISGLKVVLEDDHEAVEHTFIMLDALLLSIKNKMSAEEEMKKGITIRTKWGKSLIVETSNDEVLKQGLKSGYTFIARKDPNRGIIRIKTLPDKDYDLTPLYEAILKQDKKGTWFLHSSKNMLLNGSSKNENSVASPLTAAKLIEIIKSV